MYDHTDAEMAAAILPFFPDTDPEAMTRVVARYRGIEAWNHTPVMKPETLEMLETVMESAGELERRVDFDALVDNTFAEKTVQ